VFEFGGVDGYVWTEEFDENVFDVKAGFFWSSGSSSVIVRSIVFALSVLFVSLSNVVIKPAYERSQCFTHGVYLFAFDTIGAYEMHDECGR